MARKHRENAERVAQQASEAARATQQVSQETAPATEPAHTPERQPVVQVTPRNEPRRRAMEEIEARDLRSKGIVEEAAAPAPEPTPPAEDPLPPSPEAMLEGGKFSAPEPQPEPQETEPVEPAAEAVPMTHVKIDGEEMDVPTADVDEYGGVRAYQIAKAAENRLKKANEAIAETRKVQAAAVEWAQQQLRQHQAAQPPQPTDDEFIASKLDEIRFGTPEQGAAALREVLQRTNKQVDPAAIVAQATTQIRHEQAVNEFNREFADIASNPILLRAATSIRDERIRNLTGPVDWSNFYRTIGNEIRLAAGKPSQATTQASAVAAPTSGTPSQSPSDKEARKASIVNLPTAAARAEVPKDSKQSETREDVLNQMRKSRGIPTG